MPTIYLKDGRMADLVTKTEKGYLVDPYCTFKYYEDNEESAPSGNVELVQEIFTEAPKELIEAECQKIYDRMQVITTERDKLQVEKNTLSQEVDSLKRKKTDLSRYLINLEELRTAKRLVLWPNSTIVPRIMDGLTGHKFNVCYEISQYAGEERVWCYKASSEQKRAEGYSTYSEYYDSKYGIKIDISDEEIFEITQSRIAELKKSSYNFDHLLIHTPDQWLNELYQEEKRKLVEKKKSDELAKAEKEYETIKQRLDSLKNELTVS